MRNLSLALLSTVALVAYSDEIRVGSLAPSSKVTLEDGSQTDLAAHYAKGYTVVYFYPKADTPGCTAQACSLRDAFSDLSAKGVAVFGVSADSVENQKKFKEKYHLPFSLVSDPKGEVAKAFGVSMIGSFMSRQAFLIKNGKVIWLDRSASTKEQAKDILAVLDGTK